MKLKGVLKNKVFWILIVAIAVGVFVRAWHFEDWMHYQLDQARDYRIIHAAVEYGPGELPLQGPRAAGSFLRLGPLLYYLEYASALVFGDTPAGSIAVILILNILTIPLFYIFARRFFDQKLSVGLSSILAASLFMVIYSRFGWNPTLLPFFMILLSYTLLRATEEKNKKSSWWLVSSGGVLAFVMNMHFIAFVAAPIIAVAYLIWTRPKIAFKYWIFATVVFIILNTPLIINDIKTGGDNTTELISVVLDRGGDDENSHSIVEKIVRNTNLHAQYYWLILTGDQLASLPDIKGNDIKCDHDCRNGMVQGVISLIMIILGVLSWIMLYRSEKKKRKKDFLKLVAVWGIIVFAVYTILAYDIAPRFFLFNAPLAFIQQDMESRMSVLKRVRELINKAIKEEKDG